MPIRWLPVRAFLTAALSALIAAAQSPRDDWKYFEHPFDLEGHLDHSLADAPLTREERAQIYRMVDDKTIHDSFGDDQRGKERETVLSARVGLIPLGPGGSSQIVVQGPQMFCGAAGGNCSIWILVRRQGKLQPALTTGGDLLMIKKDVSGGVHDISTYWHMSADEGAFGVYRWNGTRYSQIDCYSAKFDLAHPGGPPVETKGCPLQQP